MVVTIRRSADCCCGCSDIIQNNGETGACPKGQEVGNMDGLFFHFLQSEAQNTKGNW
jgi:hypothetical protein